MDVNLYLTRLREQLAASAAVGGDETVELAERLAAPLEAAARLVIQDALSDAMQEITLDLAPGMVDVRVRGRDIAFVVTRPAAPVPAVPAATASSEPSHGAIMASPRDDAGADLSSEAGTARISFRPPDRLKAEIEAAAEREGLSVNAFLVRTLTAALREGRTPPPTPPRSAPGQLTQRGSGQRLEGWVR